MAFVVNQHFYECIYFALLRTWQCVGLCNNTNLAVKGLSSQSIITYNVNDWSKVSVCIGLLSHCHHALACNLMML